MGKIKNSVADRDSQKQLMIIKKYLSASQEEHGSVTTLLCEEGHGLSSAPPTLVRERSEQFRGVGGGERRGQVMGINSHPNPWHHALRHQ